MREEPSSDDMLIVMFELQEDLQVDTFGQDPGLLDGEERIQFIKDHVMALEDELHEFLSETGWKPWALSRHVNEVAAQGELVDAFHFFMNLCLVVGLSPEMLYLKYTQKRTRNIERQQEGYDGVAGKCPQCKRSFDDVKKYYPLGGTYTLPNGQVICTYCAADGGYIQ